MEARKTLKNKEEKRPDDQGTKLFGTPNQLLKEPVPSATKKVLPRKKETLPPMVISHFEGKDKNI